jgi:hypothetical protein
MHTGKCKEYLLNAQGVKDLCKQLGLPLPRRYTKFKKQRVLDHARKQYSAVIETGLFEYDEKSNRQFNDIQNIPTALRTQLFREYGYWYDYDIKSAAMTLIYQYAQQCGLTKSTPEIERYLADPNGWRNELAEAINCDAKTAKRIITARLEGATLRYDNSIHNLLGNSFIKMHRLKHLEQFQRISKEFTYLWDSIKKDRSDICVKWNGRLKAMIYFELERKVMRVVQRELTQMKCRFFLEHDGWRCDEFVVPNELEQRIKAKTGFVIQLEWYK